MKNQMVGIALILCGIWATVFFGFVLQEGDGPLSMTFFLAALLLPIIGLIWVIASRKKP